MDEPSILIDDFWIDSDLWSIFMSEVLMSSNQCYRYNIESGRYIIKSACHIIKSDRYTTKFS